MSGRCLNGLIILLVITISLVIYANDVKANNEKDYGYLCIYYIDEMENQIIKPSVHKGKLNQSFSVRPRTFEGYKLVFVVKPITSIVNETDTNVKGKYYKIKQNIYYKYQSTISKRRLTFKKTNQYNYKLLSVIISFLIYILLTKKIYKIYKE